MLRKLLNKEKLPETLLSEAQDATPLSKKNLTHIIKKLIKKDHDYQQSKSRQPRLLDDLYTIFLKARAKGHFRAQERRHPGILDEDYPDATGGSGSTAGLASYGMLKYLISVYRRSNPGYSQEHRALMHSIRAFFHGSLDHEKKLFLRQQLIHRLQANRQANQHCKLLGLYRLPAIENWTPAQTAKCYDYTTHMAYSREIARSGLYHLVRSDGERSFYYRKRSQYLAAAMILPGYSHLEVQNTIKKLLMHRFGDTLTSQYVKTPMYSRSIARAKFILRDSWSVSRTAPQSRGSRPPLSGIAWH